MLVLVKQAELTLLLDLASAFLAAAGALPGLPLLATACGLCWSCAVAAAAKANLTADAKAGRLLSSGATQSGKVMAVCITRVCSET